MIYLCNNDLLPGRMIYLPCMNDLFARYEWFICLATMIYYQIEMIYLPGNNDLLPVKNDLFAR